MSIIKMILVFSFVFVFGVPIMEINKSNTELEYAIKTSYEDRIWNDFSYEMVDITMYNPDPSQTDDSPYITADMSKINKLDPSSHKWVAVSYDLHTRYGGNLNFGDTIYVYGTSNKDGLYVVRDLMNPRFTYKIDILESKSESLYKFENCFIFFTRHENKYGDFLVYADIFENKLNNVN